MKKSSSWTPATGSRLEKEISDFGGKGKGKPRRAGFCRQSERGKRGRTEAAERPREDAGAVGERESAGGERRPLGYRARSQ